MKVGRLVLLSLVAFYFDLAPGPVDLLAILTDAFKMYLPNCVKIHAAEEASKELSAEEVELLNMAEKAEENSSKVKSKNAETVKVCREPIDEICPDSDYQQETPAVEVDEAELARDILVEKVLVYPVTEPIEKKADVEQEVRERFSEIGVEVKQMDTKITFRGEFKGSVVTISPVNLNRIWGRRLNLKNCSVIHYKA